MNPLSASLSALRALLGDALPVDDGLLLGFILGGVVVGGSFIIYDILSPVYWKIRKWFRLLHLKK